MSSRLPGTPLPCPFCGGEEASIGAGDFMQCPNCLADGPFDQHRAGINWNTRHPGPLTLHGYRPEHGDPLAWAAEQIEEAATTIRELRNDVGALTAANATLLDALRTCGEVFSVRRWILERIFGKG